MSETTHTIKTKKTSNSTRMSESAVPLVPNGQLVFLDWHPGRCFLSGFKPSQNYGDWFTILFLSIQNGKHFTQTRNTEECFCMFVLLACAMQCDPTKHKPYIHVPFAGLYCNCSTKAVIMFLRNIITKFEIFISMTLQSYQVSMAWCKATFTGNSYISWENPMVFAFDFPLDHSIDLGKL